MSALLLAGVGQTVSEAKSAPSQKTSGSSMKIGYKRHGIQLGRAYQGDQENYG